MMARSWSPSLAGPVYAFHSVGRTSSIGVVTATKYFLKIKDAPLRQYGEASLGWPSGLSAVSRSCKIACRNWYSAPERLSTPVAAHRRGIATTGKADGGVPPASIWPLRTPEPATQLALFRECQ